MDWSPALAFPLLAVGALVLVTAGVRFAHVVDELADRTGIGEALAGAVLLGATTSLPGLITTIVGAADGEASFAVSNAIGGIAAQTTFLVIADLTYRKVNLEHAAASVSNLLQAALLVALIGLVMAASAGPDVTFWSVSPATVMLVGLYVYGVGLARRIGEAPAWDPRRTAETVVDEPDPGDGGAERTQRLWIEFAVLVVVVGATGWVVGTAGVSLVRGSGLSGSVVGALFTAVVTSLPELVTVLAAVRIGALTLAVADIIGGNTFDVLFVAAADVAFRGGSIYHAAGTEAIFLMAVTVVMTAVLAAGLLVRERRGIGFEGVTILGIYGLAVASLAVGFS